MLLQFMNPLISAWIDCHSWVLREVVRGVSEEAMIGGFPSLHLGEYGFICAVGDLSIVAGLQSGRRSPMSALWCCSGYVDNLI